MGRARHNLTLSLMSVICLAGCQANFDYDFSRTDGGFQDGWVVDGQVGDGQVGDSAVPPDSGDGAIPPDAAVDAAIPPGCGNSVVEAPEVCDDGNNISGDGCSADCRSDESCGNNIADVAAGEQCDGNDLQGQGCLDHGINAPSGVLACSGGCTFVTAGCCPVWQSERVTDIDDGGGGWISETAIALDSANRPRIAFYDDTAQDLKYASWNGSTWDVEFVDTTGYMGLYAALALDSQDRPHIAYGDRSNDDLKYAYFNGATWDLSIVESDGDSGTQTSIAVDSQNHPHIVYRKQTGALLRYAYHNGSNWSLETIDDWGWRTAVAVDAANRPHVSYYQWTNDLELRYAYHNGASWQIDPVEFVGLSVTIMPQGDTSLALDSQGHAHIAYQHVDNEDLKYAHWNGSSWLIETVDSQGNVGEDLSLALDTSGAPVIAYRDSTNSASKVAWWTGSAWLFHDPDDLGNTGGLYISLAMTSTDLAHIAFDYTGAADLRHAWQEACP